MIRLTAYVSGRVQRTGYRAKVVSLAEEMELVGFVQNRPNGQVLVIAEGKRNELEKLASALQIKNAIIDVENVDTQYSQGSGQYSIFRKITGPEEIGERLDDGIEVLKEIVVVLREVKEDTSSMLEKQNATVSILNGVKEDTSSIRSDISELKKDAKDSILERYLELRQEIVEIKATLSEIKAKVA